MSERRRGFGYGVRMVLTFFFLTGCARVTLESKEPIKLDVTMRLDIYQHVTQDADAIESMISSPAAPQQGTASNKTSLRWLGVEEAYAQDGDFPPDIQQAIDRRRERRSELVAWQGKGVLGEDSKGFVAVRISGQAEAEALARDENKDRRVIYAYVAEKNGATVEETGKIFAQRIQADAPAGTPIETADGKGGAGWKKK